MMRGHVWCGVGMAGGMRGRGGACMAGGMCGRGVCMAGQTVTAAGSTYPTGMYSCIFNF